MTQEMIMTALYGGILYICITAGISIIMWVFSGDKEALVWNWKPKYQFRVFKVGIYWIIVILIIYWMRHG